MSNDQTGGLTPKPVPHPPTAVPNPFKGNATPGTTASGDAAGTDDDDAN